MRSFGVAITVALLVLALAACAPGLTPTPAPPTPAPATATPMQPTPTPAPPTPTPGKQIKITIWCHWVDEPTLQKVVETMLADYEAEHPNVDIKIEYSQKADFLTAAIAAFTVGQGGPDLFYVDREAEQTFTIVDAGWAAPLEDIIDWSQMLPAAKDASTWTNIKGETHTWYGMIEAYGNMILYNPQIFEKLGIEVPANYQFTAEEFYNMCKKCRDAGYDPFGTGSGDRKYPGQYLYKYALVSKLGMADFIRLWNGEISWNEPKVREALEWVQSVVDIPAFPATYSTMTLAESFQYFHTQQRACMFNVGTWYTGRTFKPPEEGGAPRDFRNGFLRYPAFPDGKGTNEGMLDPGAGFMVWKQGPNVEVAKDIVRHMLQEKYGTLWVAETGGLPAIKYDPAAIPDSHPFKWYFEEFAKAYDGYNWQVNLSNPCPELRSAYEAYINDGLAARGITLDEAIAGIEQARAVCQKK